MATDETASQTLPPLLPAGIITLLIDAARARRLRGGSPAAIADALTTLAAGLPGRLEVFGPMFSAPTPSPAVRHDWRAIGDAFWRDGGATREEKRAAGSFYTPPAVIDRIVTTLWPDVAGPGGTVCDPAVGAGYFLLRLVERLKKRYAAAAVRRWASSSLHGVDVHPGAVYLTRALLWLTLSDGREEFLPDPGHFPCGDSLLGPAFGEAGGGDGLDWGRAFPEVRARGGFAVILGNPPYEVLTNFRRRPENREYAERLRAGGSYRDSLTGQVNLYRCFIERSLGLLREGGALSMVVPLSLARDAAAGALRRRLLTRERAAAWELFTERQGVLGGVTQSACIFCARKNGGAAERLTVTAGGGRSVVRLNELRLEEGAAVPMLDRRGMKLWRWLREHVPGDLAAAAAMRVGEVDQTIFRVCMRDAESGCLLARGAHLRPFHLDVRPLAGKERFLDLPLFLRMKGAAAAACRERAGERRVVQLGIRNMETRPRLAAAIAPAGVYLGNSLNVYAPAPGVSRELLAGVLNSRLLDWLFRVESGNNNINLVEMRRLPFPPGRGGAERIEQAYVLCAAAAERGEDVAAARRELDAAVEAWYGVPEELAAALGG